MFIFQCHLLGTDLEDILTVWLDLAAEPVAINQISPGPCTLSKTSTNMWTTSIQIRYPDGGPTPDTASYVYKLEKEKEARERGEVKDNRSFLAKYVRKRIFFPQYVYENGDLFSSFYSSTSGNE